MTYGSVFPSSPVTNNGDMKNIHEFLKAIFCKLDIFEPFFFPSVMLQTVTVILDNCWNLMLPVTVDLNWRRDARSVLVQQYLMVWMLSKHDLCNSAFLMIGKRSQMVLIIYKEDGSITAARMVQVGTPWAQHKKDWCIFMMLERCAWVFHFSGNWLKQKWTLSRVTPN